MRRKLWKTLFSLSAALFFSSVLATTVYAATSTSTTDESSDPIWILIVSPIFVLVLTVGLLLFKLTEKGGYGVSAQDREKIAIKNTLPDRTQQIVGIIHQNDPKFSEVKFKSFAEYVYTTLEEESCNRNISHIRLFLHDNLYQSMQQKIDIKVQNHIISVLKNIDTSDTYFTSYSIDENTERLAVCLYVSQVFYEVNQFSNQIINGDPKNKHYNGYILNFIRKTGVKTNELNGELKSHNCPNCGAPLGNTGKCDYCDSILTTGAYSWVLRDYSVISDRTLDYGITINKRRIV